MVVVIVDAKPRKQRRRRLPVMRNGPEKGFSGFDGDAHPIYQFIESHCPLAIESG